MPTDSFSPAVGIESASSQAYGFNVQAEVPPGTTAGELTITRFDSILLFTAVNMMIDNAGGLVYWDGVVETYNNGSIADGTSIELVKQRAEAIAMGILAEMEMMYGLP